MDYPTLFLILWFSYISYQLHAWDQWISSFSGWIQTSTTLNSERSLLLLFIIVFLFSFRIKMIKCKLASDLFPYLFLWTPILYMIILFVMRSWRLRHFRSWLCKPTEWYAVFEYIFSFICLRSMLWAILRILRKWQSVCNSLNYSAILFGYKIFFSFDINKFRLLHWLLAQYFYLFFCFLFFGFWLLRHRNEHWDVLNYLL